MPDKIICLNAAEGIRAAVQLISCRSSCGTTLVTVSGGSCSGKSYFTARLTRHLDSLGIKSAVVCLDDYFKNGNDPTVPRNDTGRKLFDSPESFHSAECRKHLRQLLTGKTAVVPKYSFAVMRRVADKSVSPAPVIIIEGLFALRFYGSLCPRQVNIFMDASVGVRETRRLNRDITLALSEEEIEENFWAKVVPCHQKYVAPQIVLADIIINTDLSR
jgi:uridine kinase